MKVKITDIKKYLSYEKGMNRQEIKVVMPKILASFHDSTTYETIESVIEKNINPATPLWAIPIEIALL